MTFSYIAFALLLIQAVEAADTTPAIADELKVISSDYPLEHQLIVKKIEGGKFDQEALVPFISVMHSCKERLPPAEDVGFLHAASVYHAAWRALIPLMNGCKDDIVVANICREWDTGFSEPAKKTIPMIQLIALQTVWDHRLSTEPMWRFIETSQSEQRAIDSMGAALYNCGDKDVIARLERIQSSSSDMRIKLSIQKSLNWTHYKFNKDAEKYAGPGPNESHPPILTLEMLKQLN